MRIRLHTKRKRRRRISIRQKWMLAGSVCLLLGCGAGLLRYAVNARRSAQISQTFQELYAGPDEQAAARGPVLRQFENFTAPEADSSARAHGRGGRII